MKKNDFEAKFQKYEALKKAYDKADEAGDEQGKQAARDGYKELEDSIYAEGETYAKVERFYRSARERGNDYIDFAEPSEYRDAKELVETLREYGIDHFTFSTGWSSAVETAWEFIQNGCTLEGMVEIRSIYRDFLNNKEYEKAPAYLFKVN